jgi:CRISPR-associated protein Cmr3
MKTLPWPYPSTVTGAMRTALGKIGGSDFPPDVVCALKMVSVHGPLPVSKGSLYFPCPKDAVLRADDGRMFAARPVGDGDNPKPVCLPADTEDGFKPALLPAFWSTTKITEWLLSASDAGVAAPGEAEGIGTPAVDYRTHTRIEENTGSAQEGMLFQTAGLALSPEVQLCVRVAGHECFGGILEDQLPFLRPVGGERRLARWELSTCALWKCPESIRETVQGCQRIRMVLATPAIFENGWLPGWLKDGHLPGTAVPVSLVGAVVGRWQPISGWNLERGRTGPKPVRRLVPAGSVYFLEVPKGIKLPIEDLWLAPVSDDDQDRRDGFGSAIWGTWN